MYFLSTIPLQLKTDNGPAYTGKQFKEFCNLWNINYVTEIPYNPQQGPADVEWHQQILRKQI